MNQDVKALEEALVKAEHCGKFSKSSRCTVEAEETDEWPRVTLSVQANKIVGPKLAAYIAACSPDRIRRLLDYIRKLEQEARQYEFLNGRAVKHTGYDVYGNGCHWSIGFVSDDSNLDFDAAVEAILRKEVANGK